MSERKSVLFRVLRRKEIRRRRRNRLGWMIFPSRLFQLVLVVAPTYNEFFPISLPFSSPGFVSVLGTNVPKRRRYSS